MLPAVWQLGAREQQPRTVSQHLIHLRFALHGCNIVTFKVSVSRSQNRTLRASQPRATITRTASAPVPIRPLVGFGNPTLESRIREQPGNNKSSLPFLDVLLCSFMPP